MPERLCTVNGCGKPVRALGLCPMHYERKRRNASDWDGLTPDKATTDGVCEVEGCDRVRLARGLCETHYTRKRRGRRDWAAPIAPRRGQREPQLVECEAEGCSRWARVKGLCKVHYERRQREEA